MRKRSSGADGRSRGCTQEESILTEELLVRMFAGDEQAEHLLFGELQTFLLRELRNHRLRTAAGPHISLGDLVNEVWLRCLAGGALQRFRTDGRGSLRRFLCRILNRTLVDVLRRDRAVKRGGLETIVAHQALPDSNGLQLSVRAPDPTPSSGARFLEMWELCESVLTKRELEVFQLVETEGRSCKEISSRLGESDSAIRSILFRARHKLFLAFCKAGIESPRG